MLAFKRGVFCPPCEEVSFQPVQASPAGVQALIAAGLNEEEIVTLYQIVGFISFQSRLLRACVCWAVSPLAVSRSVFPGRENGIATPTVRVESLRHRPLLGLN